MYQEISRAREPDMFVIRIGFSGIINLTQLYRQGRVALDSFFFPLVTKGIATRSKKLLVAPGITTSRKDAIWWRHVEAIDIRLEAIPY